MLGLVAERLCVDAVGQNFIAEQSCNCPNPCDVTKYEYILSQNNWPTNTSLVSIQPLYG